MTAHELYVGLDGGGSGTTVVVHDRAGHERARLEGPPTLVRTGEEGTAADTIERLVRRALGEAGARAPVEALVCALAGVGREPARVAVADALEGRRLARKLRVTTDAEAALFDAFGDGAGIVLVAGTGSVAWGRAEDGRTARVGGWGALLGDEGGGFAIGLAALRAVARAHDGRGPETALTETLVDVDAEGLIAWADTAGKSDIARLAPVVVREANAGDAQASEIIDDAARQLATHVRALHDRLKPWKGTAPVALGGGLALPDRPLRPLIADALAGLALPLDLREQAVDGARGAAGMGTPSITV